MAAWNKFPSSGWKRSTRHEELIARLSPGTSVTCYYVQQGNLSWLVSRSEQGEVTGSRAVGPKMAYADPEVAAEMWKAAQSCDVKN